MHIGDLLIIWSKLCPECNYLKLLEVVCHLAKFRTRGNGGVCVRGRAVVTLCKCVSSSPLEGSEITDELLKSVLKSEKEVISVAGGTFRCGFI